MNEVQLESRRLPTHERCRSSLTRLKISFRVVRYPIAGVLAVAATSKAWFPVTDSMAPQLANALIAFELFLAAWLSSGLRPRLSWGAATVCFSVFTTVSAIKVAAGETDCGCFGEVAMSPWATLGLDLSVLTALLFSFPDSKAADVPLRVGRSYAPATMVVGSSAAALAAFAYILAAGIFGRNETAPMEPQRWHGESFPLLPQIDIGSELTIGDWTVVLYRSECGQCQSFISAFAEDEMLPIGADSQRIAFVALDSDVGFAIGGRFRHGILTDATLGVNLATPLVVALSDGMVVDVMMPAQLQNLASL